MWQCATSISYRKYLGIFLVLIAIGLWTIAFYKPLSGQPMTLNKALSRYTNQADSDREYLLKRDTRENTSYAQSEKTYDVDPADVTVVSAYIDIGTIPERHYSKRKEKGLYLKWMAIFRSIHNPLVLYTNSETAVERILNVRENLPTKVVFVQKNSTWAWSLLDRITQIYDKIPLENRHYPNQVYPQYTTVTHAKFEFVGEACEHNYFSTKYITWLDIGMYRDFVNEGDFTPFVVKPPEYFDQTKIAINKIREVHRSETYQVILDQSSSVYCGCVFFGEVNAMKLFTEDYKKHVDIILHFYHRSNCEEQILGAMYAARDSPFTPAVQLQLYYAKDIPNCDNWYCLGKQLRLRGILGSNYTLYRRLSTVGRLPPMKIKSSK